MISFGPVIGRFQTAGLDVGFNLLIPCVDDELLEPFFNPLSMNKITSAAKGLVVTKAERHLKRRLTAGEAAVVGGWAEEVVKIFADDWTGRQIAEVLAEGTKPDNPVVLLKSLAGAKETIARDWEKLTGFHKGEARGMVRAFAFDFAVASFSQWLLQLLKAHRLPAKIRVLKFGLCEHAAGCWLYASGCVRYDRESSEWASEADWWRDDHVTELNELSALWLNLKGTKVEPWITVQAMVILLIRAFFEEHGDEFRKVTKRQHVNIATGFDDGDLYEVQTPISPKT
ncbi:MAG: hypothetical protein KIT22_03260 [Verrucomicrobiae bacterium]|nr:hypothetical protein [Verrucomicrobiae bacterium]